MTSDAATLDLARAAGLEVDWTDQSGAPQRVAIGVLRAVLAALGLPAETDGDVRESEAELARRAAPRSAPLLTAERGLPIVVPGPPGSWCLTLEAGGRLEGPAGSAPDSAQVPFGYHRLEALGWNGTIAMAPPSGWTLAQAGGGLTGLAVQIYALWRRGEAWNGDFAALAELARLTALATSAAHGLDALAISPVHALFTTDPGRACPYAPSSRIALNPALAPCRDRPRSADVGAALIDWPAMVGERLASFREEFAREGGGAAFAAFRRRAGPDRHAHALFEAIATTQGAQGGGADWRRWPTDLAAPETAAARQFAERHAGEVAFHLYLQYRAEAGLAMAAAAARDAGLRIGLITDLAVGADPGGSEAWTRQAEMLRGLAIGAPPDDFNRAGQNWGLTTFSPAGLRQGGFAGWLAMLRAALAHAGGVRIDHAMGLARLWVIPEGAAGGDGVYLVYPRQDLIRLIALESQRHHAVVLGEDLGTVPPGFSESLAAAGVAGLDVLWFQREWSGFRPPERWRRMAAAMTSTHDLPTVAGWWRERDIDWREMLGMRHEDREGRGEARQALWQAFRAAGLAEGEAPGPDDTGRVVDAAAGFVGRAASQLAILPLEDALGEVEQPNLPGTLLEHPNWRRRLPVPVESLFERPDVATRLRALRAGRGGS